MASAGSSVTRYIGPVPEINEYGEFVKSIPLPPKSKKSKTKGSWYSGLTPFERVFYHQTHNSALRFAGFKQKKTLPTCSLDLALSSNYNHDSETFATKTDTKFQSVTMGDLANRTKPRAKPAGAKKHRGFDEYAYIALSGYGPELGHPLTVGGIPRRISPHSVKLINSGNHTHLTNPGYSRQEIDGNFYRY